MKSKLEKRKYDLSIKLIQMGQALVTEGKSKKDYSITQVGNILTMCSTLVLNEVDTYEFATLCSMFSSKKILDDLENNHPEFLNFIRNKNENENYEDFIKRLRNHGK